MSKQILYFLLIVFAIHKPIVGQSSISSNDSLRVYHLAVQTDVLSVFSGEYLSIGIESRLLSSISLDLKGGLTHSDFLYNLFRHKTKNIATEETAQLGFHVGAALRKYVEGTTVFDGVFLGATAHYKTFHSVVKNEISRSKLAEELPQYRQTFDFGMEIGYSESKKYKYSQVVLEFGLRYHRKTGDIYLKTIPFQILLHYNEAKSYVPYIRLCIKVGFLA